MLQRKQWKGAPSRDSSERPRKGGLGCDVQAVATVQPPGIEVVSVRCKVSRTRQYRAVWCSIASHPRDPGPAGCWKFARNAKPTRPIPASGRRQGWPRRSERPYGRSRHGRPARPCHVSSTAAAWRRHSASASRTWDSERNHREAAPVAAGPHGNSTRRIDRYTRDFASGVKEPLDNSTS